MTLSTGPFIVLDPQDQAISLFHVVPERRTTGFEAP